MRIISLVPSWTETLLEAGLNVVGRTRYCIHPSSQIEVIPVVGGTKSVSIEKIEALSPDLIVLDKEENTLEMAKQLGKFRQHVTHVTSLQTLPVELQALAKVTESSELDRLVSHLHRALLEGPQKIKIESLPGVMKWLSRPKTPPKRILYLIWHDPWMCVTQNTFIGSVFHWMGLELWSPGSENKYPTLKLEDLNSPEVLVLASSEPYPFTRKEELLSDLECSSAIIDGEAFSWFGIRSIRFLESAT